MKEAGSGLMILGGLAILGGFFVNVSRSVGYPVGEIANLHAMHVQALIFQGGFFAFLSGVVLYAGGAINESIQAGPGNEKPKSAPEPIAAAALDEAVSPDDAETAINANGQWTIALVGIGLFLILVLAAIVAGSSRPPVPTADNAIDMNIMNMAPDMNEPYPALEMPAELNAPLPDVNASAPR